MTEPLTRRERLRAEALAAIRRIAMEQVADGGVDALSLNAIAREMGMSGPAIYRYFASRDALLTALVVDAYAALIADMRHALTQAARRSPENRFRALAEAYRRWAVDHPRAYPLLLAGGLGGSDQPEDIALASQPAMDLILGVMREVAPAAGPETPEIPARLADQLRRWARTRGSDDELPASVLLLGITTWQRLHGHVALELEGIHLAMGISSDGLFAAEVDAILGEAAGRSSPVG